jgi:putative transposase
VDFLRTAFQVSVRRACAVMLVHRAQYNYKSRKNEQAVLVERIKDIATLRTHYGYKRIYIYLKREGWRINHKRVYRLYCQEGLQLRRKKPKRRVAAKRRDDRAPITKMRDVWAMDFVADNLYNGQKLRCLTVVDAYSRLCPIIGVGFNYKATDVVTSLDEAVRKYGYPRTIRVDNGPEFISKELDLWAWSHGVTLDFSRPGKPTDNAFIESFNSRFRQECLNASWFLNLNDAKLKIESWRQEYNTARPHSAIGNKTPAEFAETASLASQGCKQRLDFLSAGGPTNG